MGDDNLLVRRTNLGLTAYPSYNLTPYQIQQDLIGKSFISQASNPTSLGAVMLAGGAFKGIQGVGYSKFLPLAGDSKVVATLLKTGINAAAVTGEAGTFVLAERGSHVLLEGASPSLLHWQGEQGVKNAWKNALVNFGAFHAVSPLTAGQNIFLRNSANASTLVAANQITGALGWTPLPQESLTSQFVQASVLDLQIQSGMQLLHGIFPRMAIPRANDPALWQKTPLPFSENSRIPNTISETLKPRFAARDEKTSLATLPRSQKAALPWKQVVWLKARFYLRVFFRNVPLAKTCIELLKNNANAPKDLSFAFSALHVIFKESSFEQRKKILAELKTAFYEAQDLSSLLTWMTIVEETHTFYSYIQGADPAERIRTEHNESFLSHFSQADLLEMGEHFRQNNLQAALSGKRVGDFITALAYEIQARRMADMVDAQVGTLETAQWLAEFLLHPKASVGSTALQNALLLLQSLSPSEGARFIERYREAFAPDVIHPFYWVLHAERQLGSGQALPEIARTWYEQRREAALEKLRADLRFADFPSEWIALERQGRQIRNVADLLAFQKSLRDKFLSEEARTQAEVAQLWTQLTPKVRGTLLKFLVGPDQFIPLTGTQALRLRKLASEGRLEYETALGSAQRSFGDRDRVLFILGNRNSVGIPEAFVEQKGEEEASRYLMIHHTHPYSSEAKNIREIYPSTHHEGPESGDLHALSSQLNKIQEGESIALSVTQARGGSIFVLRKVGGKGRVDIYTGLKSSSLLSTPSLQTNPELQNVRDGIRLWAEKKGLELHFFEIPYERVEAMQVPSLNQTDPQIPEIRNR